MLRGLYDPPGPFAPVEECEDYFAAVLACDEGLEGKRGLVEGARHDLECAMTLRGSRNAAVRDSINGKS